MFETGSDCHVSVQRPSAVCGKRSGDGERDSGLARKVFGIAPEPAFTISPENRSDSTRNRVRLHPGMAFALPRIPHKLTVGEFLATWLENTAKPSVRPKTYRSYEQMVRNHLSKTVPPDQWEKRKLDSVPGLKDVRLSSLTLQRVQQFFNDKLKGGTRRPLCATSAWSCDCR